MLSAKHMQTSPDFFRGIADPRWEQGRRHSLSTVLGIVAGAALCGMRGYQAISDWAQSIGPKTRERLNCRSENGRYVVPWNYDEDRGRISTGYGTEDMSRFRRFAVSIIKSKGVRSVAQKMRQLTRNTRLVFDYLRMTRNSCATSSTCKA